MPLICQRYLSSSLHDKTMPNGRLQLLSEKSFSEHSLLRRRNLRVVPQNNSA